MKCEHCEIEFTPKRETAIYCSDNCRVKAYNKRSGKKAKPPLQMQVLMTRLENALEKIEAIKLQPTVYDTSRIFNNTDEPLQFKKPERVKTPSEWVAEKREIPDGNTEMYQKWLKDLDASDLSSKVKTEIKFA